MKELHLGQILGEEPRQIESLPGGDICDAFRIDLAERSVFVKVRVDAPPDFFRSEAQGLEWLGAAAGLRVPQVVAVADELLVLEWLEEQPPQAPAAEVFGRGLASLHRAGADAFGAPWSGFIGSLEQDNGPFGSWYELFAQARVIPFARLAAARGALAPDGLAAIETVMDRLDRIAGPPEPPSRIHGDLWHGNVVWSGAAQPAVVDPAAHGGHRETDLAMLALFGAPDLERILASYHEVHPLADGWQTRLRLHQLHPLLVHAALFGGSYGAHAAEAARRYL